MKIIKHGNPEYMNCDDYQLECGNCGCIFLIGHTEVLSEERKLRGEATIRCPECNQLIYFIPEEHLYSDENAKYNLSSLYLSTASNRLNNQSTASNIHNMITSKEECPYKDKLYRDCLHCAYGCIDIPENEREFGNYKMFEIVCMLNKKEK